MILQITTFTRSKLCCRVFISCYLKSGPLCIQMWQITYEYAKVLVLTLNQRFSTHRMASVTNRFHLSAVGCKIKAWFSSHDQ